MRFSEFREQLKGILFHVSCFFCCITFVHIYVICLYSSDIGVNQEKLGTMLDKVMRIQRIVNKLSVEMGISEDLLPVVSEAAALVLSDLATAVVTEFTSLSGVMGRHYALRDGYSEKVVTFVNFFILDIKVDSFEINKTMNQEMTKELRKKNRSRKHILTAFHLLLVCIYNLKESCRLES